MKSEGKVTCETNAFDLGCLGMRTHAQTCLDLPGVHFVVLGVFLFKK